MYIFSYLLSINVAIAAPQYLPAVIVETNIPLTKDCHLIENQCVLKNFMNVIQDVIPLEYPQRYLGGNFVLVEFPNEDDASSWILKHQNDSNFTSLSQDRLLQHSQLDISFNDPNYEGQWYLEYLEAQNLFNKTLGNPDVINTSSI